MEKTEKVRLNLQGYFTLECFDKYGRLKWRRRFPNGMTNEGLNYALDILFKDGEDPPTWYVGLIKNYSSFAAGDTLASHAGWDESTDYSESARQAITFDAASGQQSSNTERCWFGMNASVTINGAFICNDSTKGGSTGKLLCTATFTGGNESCANGDVLKVTYEIGAS